RVSTVNVVDDSSSASNWPDRILVLYDGEHATWCNEYGEYRAAPAQRNTVGWRMVAARTPTGSSNRATSVPVVQVVDDRRNRTPLFEVYGDGKVTAAGEISAPNIGVPIRGVLDHDEEPVDPQPGDVYLVRPEPGERGVPAPAGTPLQSATDSGPPAPSYPVPFTDGAARGTPLVRAIARTSTSAPGERPVTRTCG